MGKLGRKLSAEEYAKTVFRLMLEDASSFRERDSSPFVFEQRDTLLLLQLLDVLCQCGLRNMEAFGGTGDMKRACDLKEITKMSIFNHAGICITFSSPRMIPSQPKERLRLVWISPKNEGRVGGIARICPVC